MSALMLCLPVYSSSSLKIWNEIFAAFSARMFCGNAISKQNLRAACFSNGNVIDWKSKVGLARIQTESNFGRTALLVWTPNGIWWIEIKTSWIEIEIWSEDKEEFALAPSIKKLISIWRYFDRRKVFLRPFSQLIKQDDSRTTLMQKKF